MISSFDIINIFVSSLIFLNKQDIFVLENRKILFSGIIMRSILTVLVVIVTLFIGTANKIGFNDASKKIFDKENILLTMGALGSRASVWYSSVFAASDAYFLNRDEVINGFKGSMKNTLNRLSFIFGQKQITRVEYWSVMRANYLTLWKLNNNPRTGTSPGIVASIFYFPNFLIGFFFMTLFGSLILYKLSNVIDNNNSKINYLGGFIMMFYIMPYFESPIDLLNFVDPHIVYVVLVYNSLNFNSWENKFFKEKIQLS